MSVVREERLKLAEAMMEEAEHSSEVAMRTSLSRAYYALYHLGMQITGSTSHGSVARLLGEISPLLGSEYSHFLQLRARADYTPPLRSGEDLEDFRKAFPSELNRARELFNLLKEEVYGRT